MPFGPTWKLEERGQSAPACEDRVVDLVVPTRNRKKADEVRRILQGPPMSILILDDFSGCPEVIEDGQTFEANAVKKAVAVARYTGQMALADDSGLEVEALGGGPGVYSARYAGEDADDGRNVGKLLEDMRFVRDGERRAKFVCCIVLASPDGAARTFVGTVAGTLVRDPRGARGFGYDPIFCPMGETRTFGEMGEEEKDAISHRGKALRA
ncbi:MAG: RdgB/HAM1 family non-canonical purine NTP pyrophosphatase, partial [Candidatus Tectomicrobia bacterium]|nr:RdgB/HAM1 family non-canonical purine NTP pyrophosphatase [Candidatus Tectomicrobia bacterium]